MTGDSAVPRPSRRIKIVLSVLVALAAWLLAYAPEQATAAAFVPPSLLEQAAANPNERFPVIVVGTPKGKLATSLRKEIGAGLGRVTREYAILRGVATELNGAQVVQLAKRDGIASITPDGAVKPASANTVWPQAVNLAGLSAAAPGAPTIAIVDSGIDAEPLRLRRTRRRERQPQLARAGSNRRRQRPRHARRGPRGRSLDDLRRRRAERRTSSPSTSWTPTGWR